MIFSLHLTTVLEVPLAVAAQKMGWLCSPVVCTWPANLSWNQQQSAFTGLWTGVAESSNLQQTGREHTWEQRPLMLSHTNRDCEQTFSTSEKPTYSQDHASELPCKWCTCRRIKTCYLQLMHCSLLSPSFVWIISLRGNYFQEMIPFYLLINRILVKQVCKHLLLV